MFAFTSFIITALLQLVAAQQTSLIIPGFDAQPFSVDVLGVDSQASRTTWAVHNGPTDSTFLPEDQFPGVATLVTGNNYVSIGYVLSDNNTSPTPETLAVECSLTDSTAGSCSGSVFGTPIVRATTTFTPFPVLVGTSAPASPPTSAPASPGSSSSVVSSTSSATSTTTSAAASATKTNGAMTDGIGLVSFVGLNAYMVMSLIGCMV